MPETKHSPTISSTLRECAPQSPRTNSSTQRAGPGLRMAATVWVDGSGPGPPTVTCTAGPAQILPTLSLRFLRTQLRPLLETPSLRVRWVSLGRWSRERERVAWWVTRGQRWVPEFALLRGPSPPCSIGVRTALSLTPSSRICLCSPLGPQGFHWTPGSRASGGVWVGRRGLCPECHIKGWARETVWVPRCPRVPGS